MTSPAIDPPVCSKAELLLAVGQLAQAESPSDIAARIGDVVRATTSANNAGLFLMQRDPGDSGYYLDPGKANEYIPLGKSAGGRAIIQHGKVIFRKSPFTSVTSDPLLRSETKALGAWPLDTADPAGALVVEWSTATAPTENDEKVIGTLAEIISAAMERMRVWNELGVLTESRTQSLQAVNEELETFAYTMSHDLKTPLTIIKTSIWTVRQLLRDSLDERSTLAIDRLEATVERMRGQVDGMLNMHRLTNENLHPKEVDISNLTQEIIDGLQTMNPSRKVDVTIAPALTVRGDPSMLRVVIENLIDNAWKYTSKVREARIQIGSSRDDNGRLVIFVSDNGAGYPIEKADRLFGVFQRLHSDDEFEGTGVGLASVQRIINKHGGRVWAEGSVGQGATFYFSLPEELPSDDRSSESSNTDAPH